MDNVTPEQAARRAANSRKRRQEYSPEERQAYGLRMRLGKERKKREREQALLNPESPPVSPPVETRSPGGPRAHFFSEVPGHFWYRAAYEQILEDLASRGKPATWVEVGVFQGQAVSWLGVEVWNRHLPITIHCVDPFYGWTGTPRGGELERRFHAHTDALGQALGDRWVVHPITSIAASCRFLPQTVDVVWLDGVHEYVDCRKDIAAWQPNVKVGGVIGGDDWNFEGVRQAVKSTKGGYTLIPGEKDGSPWPSWLRRLA